MAHLPLFAIADDATGAAREREGALPMGFSRRTILGTGGVVGVGLLIAVALSPAIAGAAVAALPAGGCSATATVNTQWGSGSTGGETVAIQVVNTSGVSAARWSVTWTLGDDQRIVSAWNAATTVSGRTVTATNMSYNGSVAVGGSAAFGMQLAGTGAAPVLSCDNGNTAPPADGDVNITVRDGLTPVTLVVGQTLGVSLPANYLQPKSSGAGLQLVSASGGNRSGQPVKALFRAVAVGETDVRAAMSCSLDPSPCPGALWFVQVKIVPAPTMVPVTSAAPITQ